MGGMWNYPFGAGLSTDDEKDSSKYCKGILGNFDLDCSVPFVRWFNTERGFLIYYLVVPLE